YLLIVLRLSSLCMSFFFSFTDPASTEIYTLSLHDALPISFPLITTGQAQAATGPRRGGESPTQSARVRFGNRTSGRREDPPAARSEEHTSELQSRVDLVCRLLLEKKKDKKNMKQKTINKVK